MDGSHHRTRSQRHADHKRHRTLRFESIEPRLLLTAAWSGLAQVQAQYGLTGQGQTVAVIDSGIAYDQPALGGGYGPAYRVVGGYDFADQTSNPYDFGPNGSHGTFMAGIIGSNDPAHLGVAPGVDLVSLRVFDDSGAGSLGLVEQALQWVDTHRNSFQYPITTVNLSLSAGGNYLTPPDWAFLEPDLARLQADGIFIAVAAGNSFPSYDTAGVDYPAASPYVVPVAAGDATGNLAGFSQRDAQSLVAPGVSIVSTLPSYVGVASGFGQASGTSEAAAFVAGASVVLREACQVAGNANVSEQTLDQIFMNTADTIHDPVTGQNYHRINLARAVASVMPSDGFGSTQATATDLGSLASQRSVSGTIDLAGDTDWFHFTAAQSGVVTWTAAGAEEMSPAWQLPSTLSGATRAADGSLTFAVTAGQTYTLGITSQRGAGSYTLQARLIPSSPTPVVPASVNWGTVAQQSFGTYAVGSQGMAFSVTPANSGLLTIESFSSPSQGSVSLQLVDSAGHTVGSGSGNGGQVRIDVPATAGVPFLLHAANSSTSAAAVTFRVTDLVSQTGRTVSVVGTSGSDAFTFTAGAAIQVAVNGVAYQFSTRRVDSVVIQGGSGSDTAVLTGPAGSQTATLTPGSVELSGAGFDVKTADVESVSIDGGGAGALVLDDRNGNDRLSAAGDRAIVAAATDTVTLTGFQQIDAQSLPGGTRSDQILAIDFLLQLEGPW